MAGYILKLAAARLDQAHRTVSDRADSESSSGVFEPVVEPDAVVCAKACGMVTNRGVRVDKYRRAIPSNMTRALEKRNPAE